MNKLEAMKVRKAILSWRERWTTNIGERLQADSLDLQRVLDAEIEAMNFRNAIFSKRFIHNQLQPIFVSWSKDRASEFMSEAEADLLNICEQSVPRHSASATLDAHDSVDGLKDMVGATLSSAMALAAIPAVVTLSTATVSVGGVLGLLGVTASVFVFKQLVLGVFALLLRIRPAKSSSPPCKAKPWCALKFKWAPRLGFAELARCLCQTLTEKRLRYPGLRLTAIIMIVPWD